MTEPEPKQAPSRLKRLGELGLLVGSGFAAAGIAYAVSRHSTSPPPASTLAPYKLPLVAGGPTAEQEIAFYRKRTEANPKGAQDFVALANAYLRKARATGEPSYFLFAEQAARRSLQNMADDNEGARMVLVRVAIARHQFPQALKLLQALDSPGQKRLKLVPTYMTIDLALGRLAEAARLGEALAKKEPGLGSYTQLGLAYTAQGREPLAIAAFKRGIELEQPGEREESALARAWLARLHLKRGRTVECQDLLLEADRVLPNNPVVLGLRGDLAVRLKQYPEAELKYQQAYTAGVNAALIGAEARAHDAAGDAAGAAVLRARAIADLRRDLAASDFGHRRDLAYMLLELRQPAADAEALGLLASELKLRQDVETLYLEGWALARAGRWADSRQTLARAIATGYRDPLLAAREALAAEKLSDVQAAAKLRANARAADPGYEAQPGYAALAADGFRP